MRCACARQRRAAIVALQLPKRKRNHNRLVNWHATRHVKITVQNRAFHLKNPSPLPHARASSICQYISSRNTGASVKFTRFSAARQWFKNHPSNPLETCLALASHDNCFKQAHAKSIGHPKTKRRQI